MIVGSKQNTGNNNVKETVTTGRSIAITLEVKESLVKYNFITIFVSLNL